MQFHSFEFLFFLLATLTAFYLSPVRVRSVVLLSASACFYAFAGPVYLLQVIAVTAFTFWIAQRIELTQDAPARKRLTTVGISVLVLNLVAFKYSAFLNESLRDLLAAGGITYGVPRFAALLPLGISFYTFQLIGYLVDVHRGLATERDPQRFALFVLFFPKMVAGPIERARTLLPQLQRAAQFDYATFVGGLQLITWGLFKKVVVADRLAPFVARVYDDPAMHSGPLTVLATLLYAFQLYCDFSGYSDMALGVARLFGVKLTQNFNRPYIAISIQDFWKRWHISLSSWLTDYLYTPLTRQKRVKIKLFTMMLLALFITFVASGFWHGARWTYVVWGALHGTYIVTSLQTQKLRARVNKATGLVARPRLHRALRIATTFLLVCVAYVVFRAGSLADAGRLFASLGTGWAAAPRTVSAFVFQSLPAFVFGVMGIGTVLLAESVMAKPGTRVALTQSVALRWSLYVTATLTIVVLGAFYDREQQFIYFRF